MTKARKATAREEFLDIRLLTEKQLAYEFDVDRITLWRWRAEGLPWVLLGSRAVRYRLTDVQTWLVGREMAPRPTRGEVAA